MLRVEKSSFGVMKPSCIRAVVGPEADALHAGEAVVGRGLEFEIVVAREMRSAALGVEREPSVVGIDQFDVVGLVGEDRNAPRAAFPGGYDLFLVGAELGDAGLFAVVFFAGRERQPAQQREQQPSVQ